MQLESKSNGKMPTSEQHRILLVGNWLKRYAATYPMYGKTLDDFPERFDEFLDEFKNETPEVLDEAFKSARGNCKEFPTPYDVRQQIREKQKSEDLFGAEKAWDLAVRVSHKFWHPDIGYYRDCPVIDGPTEHAIRQIGGMRRLNSMLIDQQDFVRRDFIAAYKRHMDTGGYLAPSRMEAAKLLESLKRGELPA